MSVVRDNLYAKVFRISQGDLGLFKQVTDSFLESVTSSGISAKEQRQEQGEEHKPAAGEYVVQAFNSDRRGDLP